MTQTEYSAKTYFIHQAHEPITFKSALTKVYRTQPESSQAVIRMASNQFQIQCLGLSVFISLGILRSNLNQNDPLSSVSSILGFFQINVPNFHIPLSSRGLRTTWSSGSQQWPHFSVLCFCCACLRKCVT